MIEIFNDDFFNKVKDIEDNSIDMVLTDPPYGIDVLNDDWNTDEINKRKSNGVIKSLPKGMKFDKKQSYKFQEFYTKVSIEIFRILKPGGLFLSFSSQRLYHRLCVSVEDSGFEIRDMLAWIYTQSQSKAFSFNHFVKKDKKISEEDKKIILEKLDGWKSLQLKPAIEPICFANKPIEDKFVNNFLKYNVGLLNTKINVGENRFPSNVLTTEEINTFMDKAFLVKKPTKKEKGDFNFHPSVKPVELMEHLIKLFTKENAIILDPFLGSGSTLVACKNTNRKGIGFERNKEYYEISKKRLGLS